MICPHCQELEEEIRQLKADLFNRDWWPPPGLHLTMMEIAIVRAMLRAGMRPLSREFLVEASRSPRSVKSDPDPRVIDTVICKMRSKLRQQRLTIDTVNGFGFRLSSETRKRLLSNPSTEPAAVAA